MTGAELLAVIADQGISVAVEGLLQDRDAAYDVMAEARQLAADEPTRGLVNLCSMRFADRNRSRFVWRAGQSSGTKGGWPRPNDV